MTIDLSMSELSDLIEGLDMAIECMADWAQDPLATPADFRQINASSRKFWRLARKLLAQYPATIICASALMARAGLRLRYRLAKRCMVSTVRR